MSVIYGTVHRHPSEVGEYLFKMKDCIDTLPQDSHTFLFQEEVGMGFLLRYGTPDDLNENMPQTDAELTFCGCGRLDNRPELCTELELPSSIPDGEILKHAYKKWGKSMVHRLCGDWIFAVYQHKRKELFIARDKHGYTSLYYTFSGDKFHFSSSPLALFAVPGFKKEVNQEEFLRRLLLRRTEEQNANLYKNLHLLPPAHTLTWKKGEPELQRYWFPEEVKERKYKDPREYGEELYHLLTLSVKARLRSYRPVASMLSGGLDSGAVATVAAKYLSTLTTFSHVPHFKEQMVQEMGDRYWRDETNNILATARHSANIQPQLIDSIEVSPLQGIRHQIKYLHQISHASANAYWTFDLPQQAAKQGYGTLLSGEMGNGTISYSGHHYLLPFRFWKNDPLRWVKTQTKSRLKAHFPQLLNFTSKSYIKYMESMYVNPRFLASLNLSNEIFRNSHSYYPTFTSAKEGMLDLLRIGGNPRCANGALKSLAYGINYRDPTGDVRIIEFCLSVPNEIFFNGQRENKYLIKRALKGILPDQVLFSKKKGLQSADIYYRLLHYRAEIDEHLPLLKSSAIVQAWMDVRKLEKDWAALLAGRLTDHSSVSRFFKAFSFSYFLLHHENAF
jgi:asparagine synthase (glutamine-hydrolysing)